MVSLYSCLNFEGVQQLQVLHVPLRQRVLVNARNVLGRAFSMVLSVDQVLTCSVAVASRGCPTPDA